VTCTSFRGARCDDCPLGPKGALRSTDREWRPVAMEDHRLRGSEILAVHQAPTPEDEKNGNLLSGRDGGTWGRGLANAGMRRPDVSSTTLIACAPPGGTGGAYRRMEDSLRRLNKQRQKQGLALLEHPAACCRPRLEADLAGFKNIITLGKSATQALTGLNRDITKLRGAPMGIDAEWQKVPYDDPKAVKLALASFDVSFVARNAHFMGTWVRDIAKARRLFDGRLRWTDPAMVWRPSPDELRLWLRELARRKERTAVFDVETSRHPQGMRPRALSLYTLAIARWGPEGEGGAIEAIGIQFLDPATGTRWYTAEQEAEVKDLLRTFFTYGAVTKMGHNAGAFDRAVIEEHFGVTPAPLVDSIFATRAANPGLPKGLKPTGRTFTDVGEWDSDDKDEDGGGAASKDADVLLRYNMMDCAVNLAMWPTIREIARRSGYYDPIRQDLADMMLPPEKAGSPLTLSDIDHIAQDRALRMTDIGIWIDQRKRAELHQEAEAQAAAVLDLLQRRLREAGVEGLTDADLDSDEDEDRLEVNPNSTAKLRDLYFGPAPRGWDLPFLPVTGGVDAAGDPIYSRKDFLTGTGDLSTSDTVHRMYLASGVLKPHQFDIMYLVRVYRRLKTKIIGTTLRPLAPEQKKYQKGIISGITKSWLHFDGRVHSIFSAHTTSVGRYGSSSPNIQNIGNKKGQGQLKKVFAAPPGFFFVGADLNQAHLFIIANVWKIPALCEAIANGYDPHNFNAATTFRDNFTKARGFRGLSEKPEKGTPAEAMRNVIKTFIYASVYGAMPETIWRVLTSTETDPPPDWLKDVAADSGLTIDALVKSTMPYLGKALDSVRALRADWLAGQPEWLEAWQREEDFYGRHGYVKSYLFGRSSGDLGEDKNKVVNFGVLSTESDIMRIVEARIDRAFPGKLFYQCHDSAAIVLPLPEGYAPDWRPKKGEPLPAYFEDVRQRYEALFRVEVPGWRFPITGEASVGFNLAEV